MSQTLLPSIQLATCQSKEAGETESLETLRRKRISCVYTTVRAQVAEGQDSKWPDESVTLGKFQQCVGGGSKTSAGKFILIALTQRDNV